MTNKMFSAREVPWMKLGFAIDVPGVTSREAIMLGGLDFEVRAQDAGYRTPDGVWHSVDNNVAIVREDTGEAYAFTSTEYEIIQYSDAFSFIDSINPKIVSAGSLFGGRQGFIVTELPDKYDIDLRLKGKDDPHKLYVIIRTSHDKSRAIEIILTTLREKCMNQLTLPSLRTGCEQMWSIRHMTNARERMEQAKSVLTRADKYVDAFEAIATSLADIDVDFERAQKTLMHVLPDRPRRDDQIESIMSAFSGSDTVGFPGTGWGLVQATQEYFEWTRPNHLATFESTFNGPLDGQAHRYADKTVRALLNVR